MLLAWGFNQFEAFQAFRLAAQEDPTSAMAEWGVAYALGPGANRCLPVVPKVQDLDRGPRVVQKAKGVYARYATGEKADLMGSLGMSDLTAGKQ